MITKFEEIVSKAAVGEVDETQLAEDLSQVQAEVRINAKANHTSHHKVDNPQEAVSQ